LTLENPIEVLFDGILKDKIHKKTIKLILEGKENEAMLEELLKGL